MANAPRNSKDTATPRGAKRRRQTIDTEAIAVYNTDETVCAHDPNVWADGENDIDVVFDPETQDETVVAIDGFSFKLPDVGNETVDFDNLFSGCVPCTHCSVKDVESNVDAWVIKSDKKKHEQSKHEQSDKTYDYDLAIILPSSTATKPRCVNDILSPHFPRIACLQYEDVVWTEKSRSIIPIFLERPSTDIQYEEFKSFVVSNASRFPNPTKPVLIGLHWKVALQWCRERNLQVFPWWTERKITDRVVRHTKSFVVMTRFSVRPVGFITAFNKKDFCDQMDGIKQRHIGVSQWYVRPYIDQSEIRRYVHVGAPCWNVSEPHHAPLYVIHQEFGIRNMAYVGIDTVRWEGRDVIYNIHTIDLPFGHDSNVGPHDVMKAVLNCL
jgi:hypothetical protein